MDYFTLFEREWQTAVPLILFLIANLVLPLLSAWAWAGCVIVDSVVISKLLDDDAMLAIFCNGLFSFWGFLVLPIAYYLYDVEQPTVLVACAGFGAALLWDAGIFHYFKAFTLKLDIAVIGSWGASYPAWTTLFSIGFMPMLAGQQWVGMLIVFLSLFFLKGGAKGKGGWAEVKTLCLYLGFTSAHFALMGYIAPTKELFWGIYPYYLAGVIFGGLCTLVIPSQRANLRRIAPVIRKHWKVFQMMEGLNVFALICQTLSPALGGHLGIVTAIGSTFHLWIELAKHLVLWRTRWAGDFKRKSSGRMIIVYACGIFLGVVLLLLRN